MTLTVHSEVVQGSPEWYDQRRGIITASVVGQLITPKTIKVANNTDTRSLTALLAAERITGWTADTYVSWDMERGHDDEPLARERYAAHYDTPVSVVGFMVEDRFGFQIGCSPDGLVGDDGMIEVKSRRPKGHVATVIADAVPAENMAQIQCGLLVSGRQWCDYVSYCGGMELWTKRVHPLEEWVTAITAAACAFEESVAEMISKYRAAVVGLPMTERQPEFTQVELKL